MEFIPGVTPADLPAPPTVDEVVRTFAGPVVALAAQDAVEETGWGTVGSGDTLIELALSYTLWRNPADRDDPANPAELTPELRASLDHVPPWPLPAWLVETRHRMRYPMLWEAVRTTRVPPTGRAEHQEPDAVLVHHVNHILINAFRAERVRGEHADAEVLGAATRAAVESGSVTFDGAAHPGLRLDADAHVTGVAVDLGDRIASAVIARDHLPYLTLALATRA